MLYQQCKSSFFLCIFLCIIFVSEAGPYGNNELTDSHINVINTSNIHTEGGLISVSPESTLTKPVLSNVSTVASVNTTIDKQSTVIHGREGVNTTDLPVKVSVTVQNTGAKNTTYIPKVSVTTEKVIPVVEPEVNLTTVKNVTIVNKIVSSTTETPIEFTGDSKIKPRKGAPTYLPESSTVKVSTEKSTTSKPTTPKPKKMKPTVTIGSDDEPYPPSNFVPHTNSKKEHNNSSDLKLKHADDYVGTKYFKKGPDYVLPIVLTILAVPLVAILFTVLYKRGAEWWQHRHYRRMDFLIDGMYNN